MNKGKVFMGMSGGVDSSVSAALLKKQGYEVVGVFIKVWQPDFFACTWKDDRRDAMRVAAKLNIPFLTLNLEKEYKHDVIDYMLSEYKAGRTPNPDIMCNKYVKFGAFLDFALKNGADFIATGHYVRIEKTGTGKNADYKLFAGTDDKKDQSYFLWTIKKDLLSKILFPVGGYKKSRVRTLAKNFGLSTWEKKDSQGLCFVGKLDIKDFLKHYIKPKRGNLLDEKNKIIGYHGGAVFLTEGERRGFTVTKKKRGNSSLPQYVIGRDIKKNTVTVSPYPHKSGGVFDLVRLKDFNLLVGGIEVGDKFGARTRYREKLVTCILVKIDVKKRTAEVKFKSLKLTSVGQSLVLYKENICVGGGIIYR
jgi:tRNA-specific 2-thiouridylase